MWQFILLFIILITSAANGRDVTHHDEMIDGMSQIEEMPMLSSSTTIHIMPPSQGPWIDQFQNQGRRAFGPPPLMPHSGFWHRPPVDFGHLSNAHRIPLNNMNRPGLINQRLQQQQLQQHQQQQQHQQNKHNDNHHMLQETEQQEQIEKQNNKQQEQQQQNNQHHSNRPRHQQRRRKKNKSRQNMKANNNGVEKPSDKQQNIKTAHSAAASNDRQQQHNMPVSPLVLFPPTLQHPSRPLNPVMPFLLTAMPNARNPVLQFPMRPSPPHQMQPALFSPHRQFVFEPTMNLPLGLGSGVMPNFMNVVTSSPKPPVVNIRGPLPAQSITEPSVFHSNDLLGQSPFPFLHHSTTMASVQHLGPAFNPRPEFLNNPSMRDNSGSAPIFIRQQQGQSLQQHQLPPIRQESGHVPIQQFLLTASSPIPSQQHQVFQTTTHLPMIDNGPWRPLVHRQPFPWRPLKLLLPGMVTESTLGTSLASSDGIISLSTTDSTLMNDLSKFEDLGVRSSEGEYLSNADFVDRNSSQTSSSLGVSPTSSDMLSSPNNDNTLVGLPFPTSSVASEVAKQPVQTQSLVSELLTLVKSVSDSPRGDVYSTHTTPRSTTSSAALNAVIESGTAVDGKDGTYESSTKNRKSRKRPFYSSYRRLVNRRTPSISFRPSSTIGVKMDVEANQEPSTTMKSLSTTTSDVTYKGNTKQNDYPNAKKPHFDSFEQDAGKNLGKDVEKAFLSYIEKPPIDFSHLDWSNRMDKLKNFSYYVFEPDKFDITSDNFYKTIVGGEQQQQLGVKTQQELRLDSSEVSSLLTKMQEDAFRSKLNGKQSLESHSEQHVVSDDPGNVGNEEETIASSEVVSSGIEDVSSTALNNVQLNSEEVQIESGFSMSSPEVDDRVQQEDSSVDEKVTKKKDHQVSELSEDNSDDISNSTESNVSYNSKTVSPKRKLVVRVRRRKHRSTTTTTSSALQVWNICD